jgi:membrane-associated phospholipid phosphatase
MVSILAMVALKAAFHRAGPTGVAAIADPGYGFPSGHSMNSMAMAVTPAYVAARERLVPGWSIVVAVLSAC